MLLAQPYLLLRLARYFRPVRPLIQRAALIGLALSWAALLMLQAEQTLPTWVTLAAAFLLITYFAVVEIYAAWLLIQGALTTTGITRQRLRLASLGSGLLALVFLFLGILIGILTVLPATLQPVVQPVVQLVVAPLLQVVLTLSGLSYYFGFAPPRWLRRNWQLQELHQFLRQTSNQVDQLPATVFDHLSEAALRTVGGAGTVTARWDPKAGQLQIDKAEDLPFTVLSINDSLGTPDLAWHQRQARLARVPAEVGPEVALWAAQWDARVVFIIPILSALQPWGILIVALRYEPLFAADDLELLTLLAGQAATALDHAKLIEDLQTINQSLEGRVAQRTTELAHANRALRTISDCNQVLVRAESETELLEQVCDLIVKTGGYRMTWVGYAQYDDNKSVRVAVKAGMVEGFLEAIHVSWADSEDGQAPLGAAIRTGQAQLVRVATDPINKVWRAAALERGYAACLALPFFAQGRIFGGLSIFSGDPNAFDAAEVRLLTELADDLAYGITALRTRSAHTYAEIALKEREASFRLLFANNPHPMWVFNKQTLAFLEVNDAAIQHYGYQRDEFLKMRISDIRPSEDRARLQAHLQSERPALNHSGVWRHQLKNGQLIDVEIVSNDLDYDNWPATLVVAQDVTERKRAETLILRHADRDQTLAELSRALAAVHLNYEAVLDTIAQRLSQLIGDSCIVRLISADAEWKAVVSHNPDPEQAALLHELVTGSPVRTGDDRTGPVIQTGEVPLDAVTSVEQMKNLADPKVWPLLERLPTYSLMIVPLQAQGQILGAVTLARNQPGHSYIEDDLTFMQDVTDRAALAIVNAQLYQESQYELAERQRVEAALRVREKHAQALLRLGRNLERAQTFAELLEAARTEIKTIIGFDSVWIYLFSADKRTATALVAGGDIAASVEQAENATLIVQGDGMLVEIAAAKDIVIVEDARTDNRTNKEIVERLGNRTIVNIPMRLLDEKLGSLGTGSFGAEGVRVLAESERDFLRALASRVAVSLDRIRVLNDRQQAETALRASESRFGQAFRNSPVALTITRLVDSCFIDVNESFLQLFGYSRDEIIGHRSTEIYINTDPVERAELGRQLREQGSVHNHEITLRTKPGDRLNMMLSAEMMELEGEAHILTTMIDITNRKQAETSLRDTLVKLEVNNRELQDFAYVASHDLQEPLRKIQAFGDRLKKQAGPALDEKSADYLERMQSAAGRMQALINDLLAFSRVTTKAQPFTLTDLNLIVKDVLSDLEVRIERSGGQVEVGSLPTIEADATQMRQVLQNLIGNALKFHKPEVAPIVKVYSNLHDGQCELTVADNGIGFDEKYLDRIFTPFQRLHGRGEYEGTGIGLSVVRKIVERHGGAVTAHSQPGQGATFVVTLPVKH